VVTHHSIETLAILQLRQLSCTQHTSGMQLHKFNRVQISTVLVGDANEIPTHPYVYVSFCEFMSSRLHQKRTRTNRLQRWSICCCLQPEYWQRRNREQELERGNDHSDHWWRQVQDQEWKGGCDRTQWHHLRQGCQQRGLHASQVGTGGEGQQHSKRRSTELSALTRGHDRGVCTSACMTVGRFWDSAHMHRSSLPTLGRFRRAETRNGESGRIHFLSRSPVLSDSRQTVV
jgi:hypothetical protein